MVSQTRKRKNIIEAKSLSNILDESLSTKRRKSERKEKMELKLL